MQKCRRKREKEREREREREREIERERRIAHLIHLIRKLWRVESNKNPKVNEIKRPDDVRFSISIWRASTFEVHGRKREKMKAIQ